MTAATRWNFVRKQFSGEQVITTNHSLSSDVSPELCIRLLNTPSIQNYSGLRSKLKTSSREWVKDFVRLDGMAMLFLALKRLGERSTVSFTNALMQLECVNCIMVVMNSREGLESMVQNKKLTRLLVTGLLLLSQFSI